LRAAKIRICVAKNKKSSVSELIGNKNLLQKIELKFINIIHNYVTINNQVIIHAYRRSYYVA